MGKNIFTTSKLTEKQIEMAQWMAKRYFCNVSDCIKQMLTPGTKNKNASNKVQDKIINVVYLNAYNILSISKYKRHIS